MRFYRTVPAPQNARRYVDDAMTMSLVSQSIHSAVRHTGGSAVIRTEASIHEDKSEQRKGGIGRRNSEP